ncbi:2-dehydro-3-deoxygalactonokinase [Hoeflea sp. YIM 152468]|uniref:2-dehydro-3-deoxygalactonokinase n=1 Tax=Hoeflea sp. YIM 152468 TaxID=3031759 RepID=UPI0023DAC334|nr:2-dehydro-3-deoxygalactonokinase [Hoeflea sp. YIM 152468]MDF1606756.1 2-dehydro-3-deoxygalactonokinase [Hoeflea sp. YIM 152468]
MSFSPALVAVDWGTSSFRLWLMSRDGTVLAEQRSDEGMSEIAARGFETVLEHHLSCLSVPANLPVVICGMAGSRQGWVEAGYLDTPADVTTIGARATLVPDAARQVIILPGLAVRSESEPDVMRGEETQLLGAHLEMPGGARYCMPGTHSKWVSMQGATVAGFETFMTGELFSTLSARTILVHSTGGDGPVEANDPAFLTGVRDGWARPAKTTHQLFSIRAGQLLYDHDTDESRARLSGLLIGAEFAGAGVHGDEQIGLVASGALQRLYHAALTACGAKVRDIDADVAVRRGLMEAWQRYSNTSGELTQS